MKKGIVLLVWICLSIVQVALAKNVKNRVLDRDGETLPSVNIMLKGTTEGTQTDLDGDFTLAVNDDEQIVVFSFVGFKTREFKAGEINSLKNITLYEGTELLKEVIVKGERSNKFSRKATDYVAKIPLKNMENSQVYSTVTNDLLISQVTTNFDDALKNAVGVQSLWSSTGRSGDGAGYYTLRGFGTQPSLVNGIASITNGNINSSNINRIEVIKGPSATLFGNVVSSYGGLINVVTKKPYQGTGGSVSFTAGSYDFYKGTIDFNTPLEFNKNIVFRVNTGFQKQGSWQDAGFQKSLFVAPSLTYKVNNKLTLNFDYELNSSKQTNSVFLFLNRYAASAFKNLDELNYDYDKSLTNNDVTLSNPTQNFRAEASYKISDNWESQTLISGSDTKSKGYYTYLYCLAGYYFGLYAQNTDAETSTLDIQENITGDFKIGKVRNKLLVGVDFLMKRLEDKGSNYMPIEVFTPQGEMVPVPASYGFPNLPVSKSNIDKMLALYGSYSNSDVRSNVLGIYASDVASITKRFSILLALRYDRYNYSGDRNTANDDREEYTKSTFSPKVGIVFQPVIDKVSLFANYQNGFSYVDPELSTDASVALSKRELRSFDLEEANQFEVGVKVNLFENRLESTISYYNIRVKNKVMGYGFSKVQDGKVHSEGFEFELNANPTKGLNIRGGFAYNDTELLESKSKPELVGQRTAESGAPWSYNFWADYKFQDHFLKNFGLGVGFNGVNDYNIMVDYPVAGEFIIPAHTIFSATVYYENSRFRIGLKANNLADKEYYVGWSTLTPQAPRTFLGTFTYKF